MSWRIALNRAVQDFQNVSFTSRVDRMSEARRDQRLRLGAEPFAPAEQLLRIDVVPTGNLRNAHARLKRFRHDRDLLGVRPIPAPIGPRDHLDPPWPPNGSVIATVKHMVKSIAQPKATLTNPLTVRYVGPAQRLRCPSQRRRCHYCGAPSPTTTNGAQTAGWALSACV